MSGMFDSFDKVLASIPAMTRNQIILESANNPSFIKTEIEPLLYQPNAARRIENRMKGVVANVLDSSKHGGSAGHWPVLRKHVKGMLDAAKDAHHQKASISGLGDEYEGYDEPEKTSSSDEDSTWDIILKGLAIGVTGGAQIYDSYAKQQAAEAKAEADAQIAALRAQTGGTTATGTRPTGGSSVAAGGGATGDGIPSWVIYAAIAALVVGGGAYALSR